MDLAQVFLVPENAAHRQYEALRAYFVDGLPGFEVANRFGYTVGSLYQLVHEFRQQPDRQFFAEPQRLRTTAEDAIPAADHPAPQAESVHLRHQQSS